MMSMATRSGYLPIDGADMTVRDHQSALRERPGGCAAACRPEWTSTFTDVASGGSD
jgi:hypothetical protein